MLHIKKILFFFLVCIGTKAFCQEVCNNGIDDDGDGLIDCYDPECSGNVACSDFFYGKPSVTCSMNPTNPAFTLNQVWESTVNVSTRSTMMVGDIDADGIPEVVCHKDGANQLYVLDGISGNIEVTINCPPIADHVDAIAIGDTDDDGLGEIYVITSDNMLRCFENDGTPKVGFTPIATGGTNESIPGIADFNNDGIPEIYKDNRIYNSLTGALIASGGNGSKGNNPGSNGAPAGMPVAADVLPDSHCANCSGLELVCGNTVYAVDITGGTLTPIANNLPGSLNDGFTSIADITMDGQLDVVVVSSGKIYVWDPRTGLQIGSTFNIPNTGAGGRANIGDYDNDGIPEIGAGGNNRYVVVDFDTATSTFSQKWVKTIVDGSEHTTGSVFDFDCDGKTQVVYRDENVLYVWDGETGNVMASIPCGSATRSEFPTIVDVDGDGQVNIVCACATGNGGSAGKVKVFNSSTNEWVGSRTVMNQHSYFVTNINDDLSIPTQQQNQGLLPKINGFQAQSPIYDVNWNSSCIPLADVNVSIDSVIYCQKTDTVVMLLNICNIGSKVNGLPLNLSVYNGNPLSSGTLISTSAISTLIYADSCSKDTIAVPFSGTSATFYVFVNDNGTSPVNAPRTTFIECDSSNNSDFAPISIPSLSLSITADTTICIGDSTILIASGGNNYKWLPISTLSDSIGSTVIAIPTTTTTYTVSGRDSIIGCPATGSITINVNPLPLAAFTNTTVCKGNNTEFTDASTTPTGTITSWQWNFGDTDSDTAQNPQHVYDSVINYNVTLIVSNNWGCKDTITDSATVYPLPVADFTVNEVCLSATTNFHDTSTLFTGSISSWLWNFGDSTTTSTSQHPNHTYTDFGQFTATVIVTTNRGCIDSITKNVLVHPLPNVAFTANNVCEGITTTFTNNSTLAANPSNDVIQQWLWNLGNGTTASTENTSHLYASTGMYSVKLIATTNFGCTDSVTFPVTVNPNPVVLFSTTDTTGCAPLCVSFQNTSSVTGSGITGWLWNFGDNNTSNSQDAFHCYENATSTVQMFSPSLTVTSDSGCVSSVTKSNYINVFPVPEAQFSVSPQSTTITNPTVSITNTSIVATLWDWNFGDSLTDNLQHPAPHTYTDTGTYTIQLIVSTPDNCKDTTYNTVVVEPEFMFYIPNAFSPNGDGINDVFTGTGIYIFEFEMMIFDRWGNLIYKTDDINEPWDGKANNGAEVAQQDVYVYSVKVTDYKSVKHNYIGTVTLTR